jgi:hypothetical protein
MLFPTKNIGRIRSFIPEDACRTLNWSLVMYRHDYGNTLLYFVKTTAVFEILQ